jgi:hypothetical protein
MTTEKILAFTAWYTREELEKAFEKVHPPDDWKGRVGGFVEDKDLKVTVEAVIFYTATKPEVTPIIPGHLYLVVSEGYRMGPAGDC